MSYRAVLFDMDGVIVDSEPLHFAAFRATLKNHGHILSLEQYKQHFAGRTDEAGFKHYFDFIGQAVELPAIVDETIKTYLALAADRLTPYPGVIEFIQDLAKRNILRAVVTGSSRTEVGMTLKALYLTDLFSAIITVEDIEHSKPKPDGYLKGAQVLGVVPTECIVIEDAPSGVQAAKAAGMRCVAVTNTHTQEELAGATLLVDRLEVSCIDSL